MKPARIIAFDAARLETRTEDCSWRASLAAMKLKGVAKATLFRGPELANCDPMARDLHVARVKPLETAVEARSSADPQIACVSCV